MASKLLETERSRNPASGAYRNSCLLTGFSFFFSVVFSPRAGLTCFLIGDTLSICHATRFNRQSLLVNFRWVPRTDPFLAIISSWRSRPGCPWVPVSRIFLCLYSCGFYIKRSKLFRELLTLLSLSSLTPRWAVLPVFGAGLRISKAPCFWFSSCSQFQSARATPTRSGNPFWQLYKTERQKHIALHAEIYFLVAPFWPHPFFA